MIIGASVVATVAHSRQVRRRHILGLVVSSLSAAALAGAVAVAIRDELDGDPWPLTAIAVVAGLLAASALGSLFVVLNWCVARALMSATAANRDVIERATRSVRSELREHARDLAKWLERIAADIARVEGEHRREVARLIERVHLVGERIEQLGGQIGQVSGQIEQLDEEIARAYQQGKTDAEAQWRMREQHLRDQLRADLERAVEEAHQAALQRGIEIGRAQRMQEEETERRERFGLGPDVIDAIKRIHRRVNGES